MLKQLRLEYVTFIVLYGFGVCYHKITSWIFLVESVCACGGKLVHVGQGPLQTIKFNIYKNLFTSLQLLTLYIYIYIFKFVVWLLTE